MIATQTTIDGSLRVTEQLQTQIVNGLVVDVNGEPVIGASVVEKGTTNGGITDINGKFTLNVKPGSTLQISFVGYQTQEVKATKTVKVVLKEDSELLSEVVVVGYGTQKKANLTGAVATVDVNKHWTVVLLRISVVDFKAQCRVLILRFQREKSVRTL